ncbi:MAG: 50S ribosomal protein L32e [Nanoarchaeota archaeon]|nr:50S ribosomal protein L32e [Nanoarchaeota archaeon]
MEIKKALELRSKKKSKKPFFLRQDGHKKRKLEQKWRKPKGSDSKMRRHLKSYRRSPSPGFGSPVIVKGLDQNGLKPILVQNADQLTKINKQTESIIIAKVGKKNRAEILKKAITLGLKIVNVKNAQESLKTIENAMKERKDKKAKTKEDKNKKTKEEAKENKKDIEQKLEETDDEKKERDNKEKNRILTKKEN